MKLKAKRDTTIGKYNFKNTRGDWSVSEGDTFEIPLDDFEVVDDADADGELHNLKIRLLQMRKTTPKPMSFDELEEHMDKKDREDITGQPGYTKDDDGKIEIDTLKSTTPKLRGETPYRTFTCPCIVGIQTCDICKPTTPKPEEPCDLPCCDDIRPIEMPLNKIAHDSAMPGYNSHFTEKMEDWMQQVTDAINHKSKGKPIEKLNIKELEVTTVDNITFLDKVNEIISKLRETKI